MKDIIDAIEIKLEKFVTQHQQIKNEKLISDKKNNTLSAELKTKEEQILDLQDKVKLMSISKSVDSSTEEVKATRLKINEYVREIDKCIALLNK